MFSNDLRNFAQNLEVLREFVDAVSLFLRERMIENAKPYAHSIYPLIEVISAPEEVFERLKEKGEESTEFENVTRTIVVKKDHSITIHLSGTSDESSKSLEGGLDAMFNGFSQTNLLYRSSLFSLISSVEWFLAVVLHRNFEEHPEALGEKDKFFSLDDLKKFGTLEDAMVYLIDSKIENIMRGSVEDWIKALRDKAHLDMGYISDTEDIIMEIFQRRNLLMHNNGVVNSIYLANVKPNLRKELKVGELLDVSPTYLETAINCLELNFTLVACELWKKAKPNDVDRGKTLDKLILDHLIKERWDIAEGLSRFQMADKNLPEAYCLVGRINYWQCIKWQGQYDKIRKEVENFDISAKQFRFQLAHFALTDRYSEFFNCLPDALEARQITMDELREWPLFREIRQQPEYEALFASQEAEQEPLIIDGSVSPEAS